MFYNLQVSHFYYPTQVLGPGFDTQPNICLLLPAISDQLDLLLSTWGGTYNPSLTDNSYIISKRIEEKKRNHRLIQKESHKMIVSQCSTAPCSLQSIFMAIVSHNVSLANLCLPGNSITQISEQRRSRAALFRSLVELSSILLFSVDFTFLNGYGSPL